MSVAPDEQKTIESAGAAPAEADTSRDPLREQAVARLKRKRRLAQDVVAFVAVNGVLWVIWALSDRTTDGSLPWPAWVTAIWGFLLAIDAWKAYGVWPRSLDRPISEAEIEREQERIRGT